MFLTTFLMAASWQLTPPGGPQRLAKVDLSGRAEAVTRVDKGEPAAKGVKGAMVFVRWKGNEREPAESDDDGAYTVDQLDPEKPLTAFFVYSRDFAIERVEVNRPRGATPLNVRFQRLSDLLTQKPSAIEAQKKVVAEFLTGNKLDAPTRQTAEEVAGRLDVLLAVVQKEPPAGKHLWGGAVWETLSSGGAPRDPGPTVFRNDLVMPLGAKKGQPAKGLRLSLTADGQRAYGSEVQVDGATPLGPGQYRVDLAGGVEDLPVGGVFGMVLFPQGKDTADRMPYCRLKRLGDGDEPDRKAKLSVRFAATAGDKDGEADDKELEDSGGPLSLVIDWDPKKKQLDFSLLDRGGGKEKTLHTRKYVGDAAPVKGDLPVLHIHLWAETRSALPAAAWVDLSGVKLPGVKAK